MAKLPGLCQPVGLFGDGFVEELFSEDVQRAFHLADVGEDGADLPLSEIVGEREVDAEIRDGRLRGVPGSMKTLNWFMRSRNFAACSGVWVA